MKDNIRELKLQQDRYIHEVNKAFTSLSGGKNTLLPLKLTSSLSDEMTHLVRIVAMKNQALSTILSSLWSSKK